MIELRDLSLHYGEKTVLEGFSLSVPKAGVTALTGPSGCGKTTLLRIIAGLTTPECGTVEGISPSHTALLFQENRLFPWRSARQNIADVLPKGRRDEADRFLQLVGLEGEGATFPAQLSGGMARRLALARCLALEAELYLLDEPFAGVDLARVKHLMDALREQGCPILLTSHEPELLALCDRVICVDGPPLRVVP